jgi:hypothetical protein
MLGKIIITSLFCHGNVSCDETDTVHVDTLDDDELDDDGKLVLLIC